MSRYQDEKRLNPDGSLLAGVVQYDSEMYAVNLTSGGDEINLSAHEALGLLAWLRQHEALLQDRAYNYYDCSECGETHHKSVKVCPMIAGSRDD
jgi:hypothetical protein